MGYRRETDHIHGLYNMNEEAMDHRGIGERDGTIQTRSYIASSTGLEYIRGGKVNALKSMLHYASVRASANVYLTGC